MTRGHFITFEGGDGAGKSTQITRLAARLDAAGIACAITREPGGTPFAEHVRGVILEGCLPPHDAMAEAFLFAAARRDHVERLIRPALAAGQWVLCDRFADSTRAYQGAAGGVDRAALHTLESLTHPGCAPDLTLILDIDPTEGRQRIVSRRQTEGQGGGADPFEERDLAFQQRLRSAFVEIAAAEPGRCRVVDGSATSDTVAAAVWQAVSARFGLERA